MVTTIIGNEPIIICPEHLQFPEPVPETLEDIYKKNGKTLKFIIDLENGLKVLLNCPCIKHNICLTKEHKEPTPDCHIGCKEAELFMLFAIQVWYYFGKYIGDKRFILDG